MADNVELDAGSGGAKIATDDDGTAQHQYVKVEFGADNTQTKVTSAAGLPVKVIEGVTPGTGATDLGKAEDAVHGSGDTGIMALGVRTDVPASTAADGDYAPLLMSEEGALWTENLPSEVDANNSSTSTLIADAVFTGTGIDLLDHQVVTVMIDASHDSATDGMQFQFSSDDSNWDVSLDFTYTVNGGRIFQFGIYARYFRVVYTNGGTGQTHFRCQTLLHHETTLTTIHRLVDDASPDRSAEISKSVIIAQAGGTGNFVPVQATNNGNFKIALEEYEGVPAGGGTEAGSLRVTLPTDGTGLLSVDDNGGSLTVDAPVGTPVNVQIGDGTTTASVDAVTNALNVEAHGSTAHDGVDTGRPVKVGGHATAGLRTAVAEADRTDASFDLAGQLRVTAEATDPVQMQIGDGTDQSSVTALSNAFANPTALETGAFNMVWNGSSWDRAHSAGSASDGVAVDTLGYQFVVGCSMGFNGTTWDRLRSTTANGLDVDVTRIAAGSNLIGDVGIGVRTSGGTTLYKNIDVDESEDAIKASAGQLYWLHVMNLSASVLFLKIYDDTVANVIVGTTVPDLTFPIPTQGDTNGAGFVLPIPNGIAFGTAITIAATTGIADNDSGAPGANECVVNAGFA